MFSVEEKHELISEIGQAGSPLLAGLISLSFDGEASLIQIHMEDPEAARPIFYLEETSWTDLAAGPSLI